MIRSPALLTLAAALAALDAPLGEPVRVDLHPDGARILREAALPAGAHRLALPVGMGDDLAVDGALAWNIQHEPGPPTQLPAALTALLPRRNVLAARLLAHALLTRHATVTLERLRTRLSAQADAPAKDVPLWGAAVEAYMTGQAALDAEQVAMARERTDLLTVAADAAGSRETALAVLDLGPTGVQAVLDADSLAATWTRTVGGGAPQRQLHVTLDRPGTVVISEARVDLHWTPAATALVKDRTVRLVRHARIDKPVALDLGRPVLRVTTRLLPADVKPQQIEAIGLAADEVGRRSGKQSSESSSSGSWGIVAAARAVPADVSDKVVAADGGISAIAATMSLPPTEPAKPPAPPTPAAAWDASGLPPLAWDLPAQALGTGVGTLAVDLASMPLTVLQDEWALFPEVAPVPLRRVTVRLDAQPLPPGRLALWVDGVYRTESWLPRQDAGGELTLRAGDDQTLYVGTLSSWQVDPAEQTTTRQRQGSDRWLYSSAAAPRTVRVYLTRPLSRAQELAVAIDPATTPAWREVQPGLLAWDLTVGPGQPTRLGLGWLLSASGGLTL